MKGTLPLIQQKIGTIQNGLLRYGRQGKKQSLQVKVTVHDANRIYCLVTTDQVSAQKLLNKQVTLIQKDGDNYLYIDGCISAETQKNRLYLAVDIRKAYWFIRRLSGGVTWLQEKCVYLPDVKMAS
jgi:hypothetical protein